MTDLVAALLWDLVCHTAVRWLFDRRHADFCIIDGAAAGESSRIDTTASASSVEAPATS